LEIKPIAELGLIHSKDFNMLLLQELQVVKMSMRNAPT